MKNSNQDTIGKKEKSKTSSSETKKEIKIKTKVLMKSSKEKQKEECISKSDTENKNKEVDAGSNTSTELVSKLKEGFSYWCTIQEACLHADITVKKFNEIIKDNEELDEEFKLLRFTPSLEARKSLFTWIQSTPKIAFDFIKAKFTDEFWANEHWENIDLDMKPEQADEMIKNIKGSDEFEANYQASQEANNKNKKINKFQKIKWDKAKEDSIAIKNNEESEESEIILLESPQMRREREIAKKYPNLYIAW